MNITIKNIKQAFAKNREEQKIINFLKNQKTIYNINTDESVETRYKSLKKTESFLTSIKNSLNVNVNNLIKILNKNLSKNIRVSESKTLTDASHKYAVLNFSKDKILRQYIIAPISKTVNGEHYINLLDTLPCSLNANYCIIFNDYDKMEDLLFVALADTIKTGSQIYEQKLIERLIKVTSKSRNKKLVRDLNTQIANAQKINIELNNSTIDSIKIIL